MKLAVIKILEGIFALSKSITKYLCITGTEFFHDGGPCHTETSPLLAEQANGCFLYDNPSVMKKINTYQN